MNKKHAPKTQPHQGNEASQRGPGGTVVPPQWRWHHHVLQSLRSRLLDTREEQAQEASAALEADPEAPADAGTDASAHDVSFALLEHEEGLLREVEDALTRIATGTYGICEESGEQIPEARLKAVPWTRYTKEAAERMERQERTPGLRR